MGSPHAPLLHPDKLESAIARPRNAAYYEGADLIQQAVILAVGISRSQAFIDGNKRAAFAAADIFLRINGRAFIGDPLEIAHRLESIAETVGREAQEAMTILFADWLRGQVGIADDQ